MKPTTILSALIFLAVIAAGTYFLFDLESLTEKEVRFVEVLEHDIARALGQDAEVFFPKASRMPSKFQMGGTPPAVYKLKVTTGRRGRRMTLDLSILRTVEKAASKFETRWIHEMRANRLGSLDEVPLTKLDPANSRLARTQRQDGTVIGLFFLAQRGRGLFGLTLKGIKLSEFSHFEDVLSATLSTIAERGPSLMLESDTPPPQPRD
ncbi:MAG: hypothetical protein VX589_11185 [Myxococcota bacterium]|nr:hypothetical protein [Myxococcota bacterium]